ncbi:hypothetical protein [Enterobacter hormaechei]|uniref:hypothetical protein n=1 Tax=Enterobacter hormaechei TaxID=158836 RepID=UPI00169AB23D|nr:hypothetical protein [Enterobacter hormaechei]EFJ2552624.1 hypothetical protein [Escherichia coli]EFO2013716.1 hypothetical protein [Escherichia coli]EHS0471964.1 hypothetical protein [Escherichia coli]WNJ35688.1 hypothetical protein RMN59_04790 [Enterobacter hormaechei subsp. hormaechei]HAT7658605.1 hypothetical protein [Enterobacter hormaechei]
MSKKERNNILRIGLAARKQRQRLLISSLEEIPGELIEHVEEVHSQPPSVEEWAALNDILTSCPGAYYRPRKRKVYTWDDSQLKKWQMLGFTSLRHYLIYNQMNNTVAGVRELDGLFFMENDNND